MDKEFEKIYKQYYEKLYTLAFRMTGTKEDAEDVLQTSFLNAYKSFRKFRGESSVYTWLYRIVLNACKKRFCKWEKLPLEEYAENTGRSEAEIYNYINNYSNVTVEDKALSNRVRETCLQMFMNCMPSKYRTVYTLRKILHLTVKETAEILNISQSNVKVNLHRACKIISSHISGKCSLVKPGAVCDCRSFASYLKESNRLDKVYDISTIRNKEKKATKIFDQELSEILKVDNLYNTTIKPIDFTEFINRIKHLRQHGDFTLLG